MSKSPDELKKIAAEIRGKLVELSHRTKTPHLGGSLSCVDILVTAYWHALRIDPKKPNDPNRDRFILSKGHASTAIYSTLAYRGFFSMDILDSYTSESSPLAEHPSPGCVPGIEAATGSLGHGLSIGLGMALAARHQKKSYRVFVVLSDGECEEGSVWEAALLAAANKLSNIVVVVDYNKWQATGRSNQVMALDPLYEKWEKFGWNSCEVDGHSVEALMEKMTVDPSKSNKPTAIVAHTVKGKGVSFIEDDNNWHYRSPTEEEVGKARKELGLV